jgi:ketosteroid isomerase-like protein
VTAVTDAAPQRAHTDRVERGPEVVSRSVEAFNRRDLPALLETLDPDVELHPFSAQLTGTTYRGEAGARQWLADVADEWSEWRVVLDEVRTIDDRVLTLGRIVARGRETSVEVEVPAAFVSTLRDGRITRLESFGDAAKALAEAGIAETA